MKRLIAFLGVLWVVYVAIVLTIGWNPLCLLFTPGGPEWITLGCDVGDPPKNPPEG